MLRGQPIVVSPNLVEISDATRGVHRSVSIAVRNYGSSEVRIVGSYSSCSCSGALGLPIAIPPRAAKDIELVLTPVCSQRRQKMHVVLLSDVASQPRILCTFIVTCPSTLDPDKAQISTQVSP